MCLYSWQYYNVILFVYRAKKMKYQCTDLEEKVLPDTMTDDDENIFKKPKAPRVSPS